MQWKDAISIDRTICASVWGIPPSVCQSTEWWLLMRVGRGLSRHASQQRSACEGAPAWGPLGKAPCEEHLRIASPDPERLGGTLSCTPAACSFVLSQTCLRFTCHASQPRYHRKDQQGHSSSHLACRAASGKSVRTQTLPGQATQCTFALLQRFMLWHCFRDLSMQCAVVQTTCIDARTLKTRHL